MALISKGIPNLIGGVSQQPDAVRFDNQCDAQDNAYPSVIDGLIKRPPTEHVAKINTTTTGNSADYFVHMINRDSTERYVATIKTDTSSATLDVDTLAGVNKTVVGYDGNPADLSYLQIDSSSTLTGDTALRAITIADYTFIVNRTKATAMHSDTDAGRSPECLFFVQQGDYGTQYTAEIVKSGTTYKTVVATPDGSTASDRDDIATDVIADAIYDGVANGNQTVTLTNGGVDSTPNTTITQHGSVVWVKCTDTTDFTVSGSDGLGDSALTVIKDEVQRLTDLPTIAPHHFRVKIVGDATDTRDDYYVRFIADNSTFGTGTWQEYRGSKDVTGAAITYKVDPTTMPHVLIRKSDGDFLFGPCDGSHALLPLWGERNCGDDVSNSDPSFIGKAINDIFLFKNRLGFLADENVILSETAEFFNFYRTTVTDLLDTAPIDVASTHSTVSILTSAIPFNKQLVLFSDQTQFLMGSGSVFSPTTVTMTKTTNYESISDVRPVTIGSSIYFGFTRGSYTGIRQYFLSGETIDIFDAVDISGQVPQYISGSLRDMAGSSHEDVICILADGDRSSLYIYKFYDQSAERVQSAWCRFKFSSNDDILGIEFIDTTLYLVVKRDDGIYLDKMRM